MQSDPALCHSPAAERNRAPILEALRQLLPARGAALEVASGSGQHALYFAAGLPGWCWQPSDADEAALASIAAWSAPAGLPNLRAPLRLDASTAPWPLEPGSCFDAIFCANLLHIAPWSACTGLMTGAGRWLAPQGLLLIYGPCFVDGLPTAASNFAFDADLRARNPAWGLRRLEDVAAAAGTVGLVLQERRAMPANNLLLAFARAAAAA